MYKTSKILLLLLFLVFSSSLVLAQDENPYADVPMSRTEDGAFVLGNPDASFKLIEFADFLCSHCQTYNETAKKFIDEYVVTGQAQFEYRMLIINETYSPYVANLVECADTLSEGLFWQAHDVMFDIIATDSLTAETATDFASRLGLDETELTTCAQTASQFQTDSMYGVAMGVTGTPTVAIQYGENAPIVVSLPGEEDFPILVNATRPTPSDPVEIETGRYAGIQTYRTDDGGIVMGDPEAPFTLVVFEDFMCPHCQEYQSTIHTFVEEYVASGEAKLEYRFYPIVNPDYSMLTAQVAECVALQDLGMFWEAHDQLFELAAAGEVNDDIATTIANLTNMDADTINDCVETSIQPQIDLQVGSGMSVTGTPGIRVRGEDGILNMLYFGQEALQSGALPIETLTALMEGSEEITIGEPDPTLFNDAFLADDSIVTNEPCSAPCWQNITPGETTLEDARAAVAEMTEDIQDGDSGFIFAIDSEQVCCQIASQDGVIANSILLQLAPTNTVGQLIEAHGEPSFVTGEPYTDSEYILILFYPDSNTIVYTIVEGADGQISDETPIFSAIYTDDEIMESIISATQLDNWKGYLTYNEYMDGEFDNVPES